MKALKTFSHLTLLSINPIRKLPIPQLIPLKSISNPRMIKSTIIKSHFIRPTSSSCFFQSSKLASKNTFSSSSSSFIPSISRSKHTSAINRSNLGQNWISVRGHQAIDRRRIASSVGNAQQNRGFMTSLGE